MLKHGFSAPLFHRGDFEPLPVGSLQKRTAICLHHGHCLLMVRRAAHFTQVPALQECDPTATQLGGPRRSYFAHNRLRKHAPELLHPVEQ